MFLSVFHSVSDIHIHIQIHGSVTQAAACMMNVCHFMYLSAGRLDNGQKCKNRSEEHTSELQSQR